MEAVTGARGLINLQRENVLRRKRRDPRIRTEKSSMEMCQETEGKKRIKN